MGGSLVTSTTLKQMLIDNAVAESINLDHVDYDSREISIAGVSGDYAYVDRSFSSAFAYDADGGTHSIDFAGNENTFILSAESGLISLDIVMTQHSRMIRR